MKALSRDVGGEIQRVIERRIRRDLRILDLANYAFRDEGDLDKLTPRDKRIARAWELPKRQVPFALESAAKRVESKVRAESQKRTDIHVENMTIQLPEKQQDELPAVYIDVEAK